MDDAKRLAIIEKINRAASGPVMVAIWTVQGTQLAMDLITDRFPYAEMLNAAASLKSKLAELESERRARQLAAEATAKSAPHNPIAPPEKPPIRLADDDRESSDAD